MKDNTNLQKSAALLIATTIDKEAAKKVKYHRIKNGHSLKNMSEFLGVSTQQIQKYEKSKDRISIGRFCQIAKFLKLEPNILLDSQTKVPDFYSEIRQKQIIKIMNLLNSIKDDCLIDGIYTCLQSAANYNAKKEVNHKNSV